jgi:hypothetical protein
LRRNNMDIEKRLAVIERRLTALENGGDVRRAP